MKLELLLEEGFELLNDIDIKGREIKGVYIGDLLSWVMANLKENQAWITIQGHVNIVAVASLNDAACIVLAENAEIEKEALEKAIEEDIPVFRTELSSYEVGVKLNNFINKE